MPGKALVGALSVNVFPTYKEIKMPTLLEKAKSIQKPHIVHSDDSITDEQIELIEAHFAGQVTMRQASYALGFKNQGSFAHFVYKALRNLYNQDRLQILK